MRQRTGPKPAQLLKSCLLLVFAAIGAQGCAPTLHLGRTPTTSLRPIRAVIRKNLPAIAPAEPSLGLLLLVDFDEGGKNPRIVDHQAGPDAYSAADVLLDRNPSPCDHESYNRITAYLAPANMPPAPEYRACVATFRQVAYNRHNESNLSDIRASIARTNALITENSASTSRALDGLSARLDRGYQVDKDQGAALKRAVTSASVNADQLNSLSRLLQDFSADIRGQNLEIQRVLDDINEQVKDIRARRP